MLSKIKRLLKDYLFDSLKKPESEIGKISPRDLRFCLRFVKPFWKLAFLSLAFTLLTALFRSVTPLSSKVLIDFVLMKKGFENVAQILSSLHLSFLIPFIEQVLGSLNLLVVAGIVFGLLSGLVNIALATINFRLSNEITFNVQRELFDRVLRFPLGFLKKKQVGYLASRVTSDASAVQALFSQFGVQVLTNFWGPVFSFAILWQMNRQLTLILLAIIPLNVFFSYFIMVRSRAISYRQMERSANISGQMMEAISGVEVVKSFGAEDRESQKVAGWMRRLLHLQYKGFVLSNFSGYVTNLMNLGVKLFVMWFSARQVLKGAMTVGDLTAFTWYATNLYSSLSGLLSQIMSLQYLLVSLRRLHEMFSVNPEFEVDEHSPHGRMPNKLLGGVEYRDVYFAYEENSPLLKGVSIRVNPGETITITGVSGAGKTTLLSLLLKFFKPQSGTIYLDGVDLLQLDTRWLRSQIGIVSQETFLFNDTIEHNIRYGKPSASREEVIEAAKRAHIHTDILRLDKGYETVVGERGATLSGGQKQRIALARAFLRNPPILILDEPTSALDRETEMALGKTLMEISRERTTFMITHRMAIAGIANRILKLENGILQEIVSESFASVQMSR